MGRRGAIVICLSNFKNTLLIIREPVLITFSSLNAYLYNLKLLAAPVLLGLGNT